MDFSQIRSGVQLKKVETVSDKSSPMLKGGLEESDIKQYKEDVLNTYVEEWGPLLETNQVTFRTDYTPIDSATAKFLEGCYLEFETFSEEEKYDSAAITNKFDEWFAEKARDPLCVRLLKNLQVVDSIHRPFILLPVSSNSSYFLISTKSDVKQVLFCT